MNTSVINSSPLFNQSSSGSNLPQNADKGCKQSLGVYSLDFTVVILNMVVGYPANIMVMWLVSRKKFDASTSDIFIFNLAIADACYCMLSPISMVSSRMLKLTNSNYLKFFAYGIKDCTPLSLACICLDRYVAVVHPIVFTNIRDNKIRVAISILLWGFTLAFAISRSLQELAMNNTFSGLVLVTFAIMVFCNISIIGSLRKSVFGKEKMHPMKKKALRTVLVSLAIIVFHYLPVVALLPFTIYVNFPKYCQVARAAFALMDLSSSIEPLIYISKMEQLPFFNNLPCICCRSPSTEPHNIST